MAVPMFPNSAKVLKKFRSELDVTQGELAKTLGVHVQYVSNWERGLCLPPDTQVTMLLRKMNLPRVPFLKALLADKKHKLELQYGSF